VSVRIYLKLILFYLGIPARIINLDEFNPRQLSTGSVALILIATHGEGEPTDSSEKFIEWVENTDGKPPDHLAGVEYAVFGLGDRTYQHFNRMGKKTHASLEKLGAHPIYPLTEGDASEDIDRDYENWRDAILPFVKEYHEKRSAAVVAGKLL
jgi:NADPH-ferrihemoprotein reductase